MSISSRRYIPKHRIQYKTWWFVTSQRFEYFIFFFIVLNTVALMMKFHGATAEYKKASELFFQALLNTNLNSSTVGDCVR
jgi:hypothetical protein